MNLLWFENLLLMRLWVWNAYLVLLWNRALDYPRALLPSGGPLSCEFWQLTTPLSVWKAVQITFRRWQGHSATSTLGHYHRRCHNVGTAWPSSASLRVYCHLAWCSQVRQCRLIAGALRLALMFKLGGCRARHVCLAGVGSQIGLHRFISGRV